MPWKYQTVLEILRWCWKVKKLVLRRSKMGEHCSRYKFLKIPKTTTLVRKRWFFTCRVMTNVAIMIPLCFLYFKTWVCTPKCLFMTNIEKNYKILGYNNRESWIKTFFSAGIFGDFSPGCLVGIQFQLSTSFPGWTLMLLGYNLYGVIY